MPDRRSDYVFCGEISEPILLRRPEAPREWWQVFVASVVRFKRG